MIRLSEPEDTSEIVRLALAQYARTPWKPGVPVAEAFHVYERFGRITGCAAYRRDEGEIQVIHVWVEDGFAGARAAVELMEDLEAMADAEKTELAFDVRGSNVGLQRAVEEHACMRVVAEIKDAVLYRRKVAVS